MINKIRRVGDIESKEKMNADQAYYQALGDRINTIYCPILYLFGFAGNILSMLTFSTKRMARLSSSCTYLFLLPISDSVILLTTLWPFLGDAFHIYLEQYSIIACRFYYYLIFLFISYSSWCLAGLCFDRFLRIEFPIRSKLWCTRKHASILMTGIFMFLVCTKWTLLFERSRTKTNKHNNRKLHHRS